MPVLAVKKILKYQSEEKRKQFHCFYRERKEKHFVVYLFSTRKERKKGKVRCLMFSLPPTHHTLKLPARYIKVVK